MGYYQLNAHELGHEGIWCGGFPLIVHSMMPDFELGLNSATIADFSLRLKIEACQLRPLEQVR
jgi:hypothetical protein